jgi:HAMP domain-containing protein
MIVICEECGKRYQIDPGKIKGRQARFNCKKCGHAVTVTKPEEEKPLPPAVDLGATQSDAPEPPPAAAAAEEPGSTGKEKGKKEKKEKREKKERKAALPARLGLRGKMFLLFFLVPILCIAAAGWLYIQQLIELSNLITGRSAKVVNQMAEDLIEMKAKTVAKQAGIYLEAHPDLPHTAFNEQPEFKEIAVQRVGKTGYTGVYELEEVDGGCRTWAHVNPKLIGVDMRKLKKSLGEYFGPFWSIWSGATREEPARGYYNWRDPDGKIRAKYAVCVPVQGTRFAVGATTYLDEFTNPVQSLQAKTAQGTAATRNTILVILVATILLIGLIVSLFGHRITGRIQSLTDVADRISVGELEADVDVRSKDEIGDLADAVSRMQDSIRLSIERLRRRR